MSVGSIADRYGAIRSLAHRHRHSRASRDRKTPFSGQTDISNINFIHGLVNGCGRGVDSANSVSSKHSEEVESGQVKQLDWVKAEDDYTDA